MKKKLKAVVGIITAVIPLVCLLNPVIVAAQKTYASSETHQVNGVCLLCGVSSPGNPVNNTSLDDYSTFNITAGILGTSVEQTLIFPSGSAAGCDSLVIGIGSGNALLSASLFGGVTVETYNGATANNDAHVVDSSVLRLLQCNTRAEVLLHPQQQFDRVKIRLSSSLVGLLTGFRVYYAFRKRSPDNPLYLPPEGMVCGAPYIIIQNHQPYVRYNVRIIYTAFSNLIQDTSYTAAGDSIRLPYYANFAGSQGDIYVQAVDTVRGCLSDSTHHSYFAGSTSVLPRVDVDSVHICQGDTAVLHAVQVTPNALYSILWYSAPTGGTLLYTGPDFRVAPAITTSYYVTAKGSCEYPKRIAVKVQVTPRIPPVLDRDTLFLIIGASDTVRAVSPAGATFRWYTAATGGTLIYTGSNLSVSFTTAGTYYYYVESVVDGCVSSRTRVVIVVSNSLRTSAAKTAITFYPNPATGLIRVVYPKDLSGAWFTINDLSGRSVHRSVITARNVIKLPPSIPAGTYVVQIHVSGNPNTISGSIVISPLQK
ncbi:MAG TPA: T9SS type A sorting domain-containing protein [Chitinophaga sp.]|uniref:Ig-like domain-containing protein n=1 Tax=Chitinophaga sp. TaxID=1869181 RepID=UPI002C2118E1|nr:T9SS type A sorting domain-containing protein [Chitinophaga sp.]HVI47310.1 T9SS type A sorting domain-containing protein [Chitinophaga sp.]